MTQEDTDAGSYLEMVHNAATAVIEEVRFSEDEDGWVYPNVDIDGQANNPEPWRSLRDALYAETEARARGPLAMREYLDKIIAAYEDTNLDHDVAYEDFAEVVRGVRQRLFFIDRDARW